MVHPLGVESVMGRDGMDCVRRGVRYIERKKEAAKTIHRPPHVLADQVLHVNDSP